ncbi:sulfatase [candidate division CSSED10-310 bacterium]|uniref:Sulfatase n=1 Tax=candidate division CSSED10-310 bacterium TaxID=2855610 RepID=A0ABV6YS92_UNCC1
MKKLATALNLLFPFLLLLVFPGCGKKSGQPHILLITIDTLRSDYLGLYDCPLDTSPFIDQLARNGVVFKHAITPLPLTDGSHATILTSLNPLVHQVISNATVLNDKVETMAEVLKNKGYYTIGTIAVSHLNRKYNFSQGFDSFSDSWDNSIAENKPHLRVAQSVHESLTGQIEVYLQHHRDKPLFIWVHYYDPHVPYINWANIHLKNYENQKDQHWHHSYAKEVRYTDDYIKKLYLFLDRKRLTKNMITCITADHGEQLGEHGHTAEHFDFYSETSFVPLIFHGYKIPKHKVVEEYVSTMDIATTLLSLANLSFDEPVHGVKLLDQKGQLKAVPPRDFLIIGDPYYVRSIQTIRGSLSYILNFDYLFEHWFVSMKNELPSSLLQKVSPDDMDLKIQEKSRSFRLQIYYPHSPRTGLQFGILRFNINKNQGFSVGYKISPANTETALQFGEQTPKTVTAYFPVTPLDQLSGIIQYQQGTEISDIQFAILSPEELGQHNLSKIAVESEIFRMLKSPRKLIANDELFDLKTDFTMMNNLLAQKEQHYDLAEHRNTIYKAIHFYQNQKEKLLGPNERKRVLTQNEEDMLKSLGYLQTE